MHNGDLAGDHLRRAEARLRGISFYRDLQAWPEVVRTAQETVELSLNAALRSYGIVPPRTHELSETLMASGTRMPEELRADLRRLADISRTLYKDRTLAFYGSEDITPSTFYRREDAERAAEDAEFAFAWAKRALAIRPDGPHSDVTPTEGSTDANNQDPKGP